MKVAYLISQYLPSLGGAQICIHNVAIELIKQNNYIAVITTTKDSNSQYYGYQIIRISQWYLKFLRFPAIGKYFLWFKLNKLQKKYLFDIWQVTVGYPLGVYAVEFFKNKGIRCVLRCCGEDIQVDKRLSYGYRLSNRIDKVVKNNYPKFDSMIALTQSVKEEYHKLGIPDKKIFIIPNGVNLKLFTKKENKNDKKNTLGLKNKIVLLTVGRNHPKKGYDLIPAILQTIYRNRSDVVWIIIGKDSGKILHPELSSRVKRGMILLDEINSNTSDSIQDIPTLKLIDYYHCADLFVFPSYIETFGLVLIEANASGLPVVTSNVPGCRDVVKDGYNGLLVKSGNYKMFANKILKLLNDKDLYDQICSNISEDIKRYDWSVVADQYRELYKNTLLKNSNPISKK